MTDTLVRRWQATIARDDASAWLAAFRERVLPGMKSQEGFLGVTAHLERGRDPCRLTVLTAWQDEAAIRRFAGERPQDAVIPDFMAPFFVSHDAEATFHDEIFLEANR